MTWRWPRQLGRFRLPASRGGQDTARVLSDRFALAQDAAERSAFERVETPLSQLLSEIEAAACAVFARHGLPDRPGHYARSPKADGWRYLSEDLTAEERWSLVNAQRAGSGWRFGTLEDLGDQADQPGEVRQAAQMLRASRGLRGRLGQGGGASLAEDLEAAVRLGAQWRDLARPRADTPAETVTDLSADPLKLSVPKKPRARRKKPRPAT